MTETGAGKIATYWDENRQKSLDPTYWMAHPLCRQAINRRVSGSPHEWSLDWFKRVHAPKGFGFGLSWGCGLGAFERAAVRMGLVREIDAFDVSPASLEDARELARKEGLTDIHYRIGDFNDPDLPSRRYDIVFFQASLHHVAALERLFRRLSFALKRGGAVYVDEFVGPSRDRWTPGDLELAQSVLDLLPEGAKEKSRLTFPIETNDLSEGIRSSEIGKFLREFFEVIDWRPYGGQLVGLILPCLKPGWADSPEGCRYIQAILEIEGHELSRDPTATHHVVAFGRLKPVTGLALPLARQTVHAVKRRLRLLKPAMRP
jgi:SAM-dependent methyltransferase